MRTFATLLVIVLSCIPVGCAAAQTKGQAVAGTLTERVPADSAPVRRAPIGSSVTRVEHAELPSSQQAGTEPATPEPAANPTRSRMTLDQLQELALRRNPTLAQAAASVDAERGSYRQVGLYPNPTAGYINNSADPSRVMQSNGVFLSQEFVTAKKIQKAREWEGHEVERFAFESEAQRVRILNDVKIRFLEVLGAQEAVIVAKTLEDLAEKGLATARKLQESGDVGRPDVLQATVQLETVRVAKEDALSRHDAAWHQLANVVGDPGLKPSLLDGSLEADIPEVTFEESLDALLNNSPQIAASQAELEHTRAEWRLARAQAVPNVTLQAVVQRDNATQSTQASTLVALPVPIFNRNQGNIQRAMAQVIAAETEIERVKLVLRDLLADSFRRYRANRTQVERFQSVVLPSARENMELVDAGFRAGDRSMLEVLSARQTFFHSRLAYVEALTELRKALVEIEGLELTGGLNPSAVGTALQSQPSGTTRQRALLNQVQESTSRQLLPAAQLGR